MKKINPGIASQRFRARVYLEVKSSLFRLPSAFYSGLGNLPSAGGASLAYRFAVPASLIVSSFCSSHFSAMQTMAALERRRRSSPSYDYRGALRPFEISWQPLSLISTLGA